jgi:hypothetical protein
MGYLNKACKTRTRFKRRGGRGELEGKIVVGQENFFESLELSRLGPDLLLMTRLSQALQNPSKGFSCYLLYNHELQVYLSQNVVGGSQIIKSVSKYVMFTQISKQTELFAEPARRRRIRLRRVDGV